LPGWFPPRFHLAPCHLLYREVVDEEFSLHVGTKNNRGNNKRTYALYEELRHLRVSPQAEVPYIYKRLDRQKDLPVEERAYQVRVPVPMEQGVRKSLRTSDRTTAIERAEDLVLEIKSVLRAGGTASKVTAEDLVSRFLKTKSARIREEDEGKSDAGRRSITKERYVLIEGKLRNYLVPFLGKSTDVRSVPLSKWNEWESWRKDNKHTRSGKNPKAITIQNEMGMIRECWKWGMENALLPFSPKLPFQNENPTLRGKLDKRFDGANTCVSAY